MSAQRPARRWVGAFLLSAVLLLVQACRQLVEPTHSEPVFWAWTIDLVDLDGTPLSECRVSVNTFRNEPGDIDYDAYFEADEDGRVELLFPSAVPVVARIRPLGNQPDYPMLLPNPATHRPTLVYRMRLRPATVDLSPIDPVDADDSRINIELEREILPGHTEGTSTFVGTEPGGIASFWASDDMWIESISIRVESENQIIDSRQRDLMESVTDVRFALPPLERASIHLSAIHPRSPSFLGELSVRAGDYVVRAAEVDFRDALVEFLAPAGLSLVQLQDFGGPWPVVPGRTFEVIWSEDEVFQLTHSAHEVDLTVLDDLGLPLARAPIRVTTLWSNSYNASTDEGGEARFYSPPGEFLLTVTHPEWRPLTKSVPFSVSADLSLTVSMPPIN